MSRRLGRGLDSLLGGAFEAPSAPREADPISNEIELDRIRPNPFQPRQTFEIEGLEELAESIRRHGVLQPVVVRSVEGGFELIAGERRWRASRLAGRKAIPAVVRSDVDDRALLELALIENVQRRDLDALERAEGYRRLILELGLTQEAVAERVGLKRATISNHLRLLELPTEVQEALRRGLITMGHARALLSLGDQGAQLALVQRIAREGLSVRHVEELARAPLARAPAGKGPAKEPTVAGAPWARELEARMRAHLGSRVRIRNGAGYRGKIVIDYYQREDLDRLIEILAPRSSL